MTTVDVRIVHAFVRDGEGGNPAGVVLDADALSAQDKQAVAREVGLSETAFVSRSAVADFKLDFFTPNRQIAHCGHATIATFSLLRRLGRLDKDRTSKETIDGVRAIAMRGDAAYMEQLAPAWFAPEDTGIEAPVIAASLGIGAALLHGRHPPVVGSTGNRFLLVAVKDASVLRDLRPDLPAIHRISDVLDLIGYCVFATCEDEGGDVATSRMFAPRYGIAEEAGTGMAAGPLACWLHDRWAMTVPAMSIAQGAFMNPPSPSRIAVELDVREGRIAGLMVGGQAREVRSITVRRPGP
jgi:PhzF family phenazine biosynthesis protein